MSDVTEDSFFLELEKAVKSLSIGTDRVSTAELRRLFDQLQADGRPMIEAVLPVAAKKPA